MHINSTIIGHYTRKETALIYRQLASRGDLHTTLYIYFIYVYIYNIIYSHYIYYILIYK